MDDLSRHPVRGGFRLRGSEITRLETFTDAAFAFAVSLLVIAGGQIPDSFASLMESLKEIPAFLGSFALIMMFWHGHQQWSRRFGLEDGGAIVLSSALVFTILVYVVPLKVLFGQGFAWASGGFLGQPFPLEGVWQLTTLFVVYGVGYVAMTGLMAALNVYAWRHRSALRLDPREEFLTRVAIWQWCLLGAPGLLSIAVAGLLPPSIGVWAGFAYMLLPIVMPIFGITVSKRAASRGFDH